MAGDAERVTVEVAGPELAEELTALARRSKAHWGYDAALMAAFWEDLRVSPARIERDRTFAARIDGELAGFAILAGDPPTGEIDFLFIDPPFMGRGVGGALLRHVLGVAREDGMTVLELDADPFAEDFYRHHGAAPIGMTPSTTVPGRTLPRMRFEL